MKRLLIAGAALTSILAAGSAFAADLSVYTKAPPVPVFTWNGAYIGANIGWSSGRQTTNGTITGTSTTAAGVATPLPTALLSGSSTLTGAVGGGQIGYNWQFGNWLVGLEGDVQATGESKTSSVFCQGTLCPTGTTLIANEGNRLSWFGTGRGRIGFLPAQQLLLYATGGVAYGSFNGEDDGLVNGRPAFGNWSNLHAGWTVGAGVEAALDYNWSVKFEYLYMDLGNVGGPSASLTTTAGGTTTVTNYAFSSKFTDNIVRVGFNYRFNPAPAVVAKY